MKRGKGETGKTQRYSTIVKNVKDSRLGPNKVTARASREVNGLRSVSKERQVQEPAPRIDPERLKKIYDEYGFPEPDTSFAQSKLPNDEKELRKILSMHRDLWNKETKQRMEQKLAAEKQEHMTNLKMNSRYDGQGGPGMPGAAPTPDMQMGMGTPQAPIASEEDEMQYSPVDISTPTEVFFVGDTGLVKIINPGQSIDNTPIWLVDVKNKALRPFTSKSAFNNYFEDPIAAKRAVVAFPSAALAEGGPLSGYRMLTGDYGIREDGTMKPLDYSPAMLSRRYGKPSDPARENKAVMALDGLMKQMRNPQQPTQPQGGQMGGQMPPPTMGQLG
jgi:hypothetical protein